MIMFLNQFISLHTLITLGIICTPIISSGVIAATTSESDTITISAKEITVEKNQIYTLKSNGKICQQEKTISADNIQYFQLSGEVITNTNVVFDHKNNFTIECETGSYNLIKETGKFYDAKFTLHPPKNKSSSLSAQGKAKSISVLNDYMLELADSSYSTCPPNEEDWAIKSSNILLDSNNGTGRASNARLEFFGAPIFYTPYIEFAIGSARKSGVLFPYISYDDVAGIDIKVPYYINIAPEYDATITLRIIGHRGVGLESELRFLTTNQSGKFNFNILPDDDLYKDSRISSSYSQSGTLFSTISNNIQLNYVSDNDYFSDMGDNSAYSEDSQLYSRIMFGFSKQNLSISGSAEAYQTIDESVIEPYRKLPEIVLSYENDKNYFSHIFNSEITYFDHDEKTKVTGSRINLIYSVHKKFSSQAFFIDPAITLRHTNYYLNNDDSNPSKTIPSIFVDSGIFLERDFTIGEKQLLQTLEPRLFVLYTPFHDQSHIPNFDTTENSFGTPQLFSTNRFSGEDRVGDTKQISAAITSRIFDNQYGYEYINFTIGEIFYFDDRKIRLSSTAQPLSEPNSNVIAAINASLPRYFTTQLAIEWNHRNNFIQAGNFSSQYKLNSSLIANLSYNIQKDDNNVLTNDAAELSFSYKISGRWNAVGKWKYSLLHSATQETFSGFKYQTCCWSATLVNQRYIEEMSQLDEAHSKILFQLQFFGLSGVGKDIDAFLEKNIFGYN